MDFRPVLYVIGIFLSILAMSMILPMLADLYTGSPDWKVFFLCIIITSFFAGSLVLSNSGQSFDISIRQAFLLTTLSWITISAFGALPFALSDLDMSFTDAYFETMSGITTTGSTVIVGLEHAPRGILLWRGILQFLGGIGFIVMALSVLPMLKVGGMRLFRTESSEREKTLPRAAQLASSIGLVYLGLNIICVIFYMLAGMDFFDAAVHSMATLATGGFSNYDASFGYFNNIQMELVAIIFMILGGLPFVLYIKAVKGDIRPLLKDTQVHWFLGVLFGCILLMTMYLVINNGFDFLNALRRTVFNITSVLTSTGFVSEDYYLWGIFTSILFFFIMFIGACAGSTSGGIKIFRFQVLFEVVNIQIKKLLHPHGVFIPYYNGKPIPKDVPLSVMGFFFVYVLIFALSSIALCLTGADIVTALSAVVACMSNVGPGIGEVVGPGGNFKSLSDPAKWVLSFCMLAGRLELFTILVLFSPHFWKR